MENVENLEFIRKSLWKNIETCGFQSLKTVSKQALDQAINHVHSFQHASEQAFFRSLWHHQNAFHRNAQLTWCFPNPAAKSSHQLKKAVGTGRNNLEFQQCQKPLHLCFSYLFEFSFQFSTIFEWKVENQGNNEFIVVKNFQSKVIFPHSIPEFAQLNGIRWEKRVHFSRIFPENV